MLRSPLQRFEILLQLARTSYNSLVQRVTHTHTLLCKEGKSQPAIHVVVLVTSSSRILKPLDFSATKFDLLDNLD